jgi:hypothetical protein
MRATLAQQKVVTMQRILDHVIVWVTLIAIGMGIWITFDNIPFASEIVVYQGWCPTAKTQAGVCQTGEESGNPITYKASQETQSVVYWFNNQAPSRMTNCAVRDAKNWSCNQGEEYSTAMVDGKLSEINKLGVMYYQVPKYRWYWLWLHTKTF